MVGGETSALAAIDTFANFRASTCERLQANAAYMHAYTSVIRSGQDATEAKRIAREILAAGHPREPGCAGFASAARGGRPGPSRPAATTGSARSRPARAGAYTCPATSRARSSPPPVISTSVAQPLGLCLRAGFRCSSAARAGATPSLSRLRPVRAEDASSETLTASHD